MTIPKVKVFSMASPQTGKAVTNQLQILTPEGMLFQSYDAIVAFRGKDGNIILDKNYWEHSRTTIKYRNLFLHERSEDVRRKVKSGEYKLEDLNG